MVVRSRLRIFEDHGQSSLTSLSVSSTIDVRSSLHCAIKKESSPKRPQRRVTFVVDANNSVLAEVISYKCNHSQFNSELYWTRSEMHGFRTNVRNALMQMQQEQPELLRRMECVLSQYDRWSDGVQRADDRRQDMYSELDTLQWPRPRSSPFEARFPCEKSPCQKCSTLSIDIARSRFTAGGYVDCFACV
jgi:hypothetical protein